MKFLSTLLLAALLPLSAGAQTYLGYTTLQYERNKGVGFSTSEATHGVAIRLPESKMQLLKGKRITGLRAAFSTRKLSELRIFATHDLTATPVAEAVVSGASTSVVEFDFNQPITIDGQPLFLGYKATLSNAEGGKPCLFDEAADLPTGYVWGYADGAWVDVSNRGLGAPILQFVVEGSADFTDVLVKPVNVQGYCKAGSDISLQGEIFNFGTTPITSLTLQTAVGDAAASQQEVTGLNVAPGAVHTYSLEGINASQPGALDLRLEVPTVNGQTDAEPADNAVTSQVFLYPANVQKRLLLENFTGQTCSNCPSGHESINTAIMGRTDDFVIVAHHAGYAPDLFTMAEDVEYTWLYNLGGSIYAPAVTINRLPYTEGASSVVFGNTTALDVTIQAQILELINRLKKAHNMSVIFITHDLGVVANMADRVAVMYAGKICEYGTDKEIFFDPRHPYTWALLASIPDIDSKEKLEAIPGTPPDMIYPPQGDAFALRNRYAIGLDFKYEPPFFEVSPTHFVASWLEFEGAPKVVPPKIVSERIHHALEEEEAKISHENK